MTVVVRSLWRSTVFAMIYHVTTVVAVGSMCQVLVEPEKAKLPTHVFAWLGVGLLVFHVLWKTLRFEHKAEAEDAKRIRQKSVVKTGATTVNLIRPAKVVDTTISGAGE